MKDIKTILIICLLFTIPQICNAKTDSPHDISIIAEVAKTGFIGESFKYEVSLISSSGDISNVRFLSGGEISGDVEEINGIVNNTRPIQIEKKGKKYFKWIIARSFIIPKKMGKVSISSSKYVVYIPYETVVYHPFWGRQKKINYEELIVSCNPVEFKVNPLPGGEHKDFCGSIGDFSIKAWFPPGEIFKSNDAYVIFSISGFGSLSDLKIPNISKLFHKNCRLKEVSQNEQQLQKDGKLYSEVILTCKFAPDEKDFEIDPLVLKFFNPESKKYYSTSSELLKWSTSASKANQKREAVEI